MSNPSSAWQQLQAGNRRFWATLASRKKAAMQDDSPVAVVFRCSDAQLASEALLDPGRGSLIDISTWGHVIDTGVLASLEHAVGTLNTPLIVVLGHAECAAMQTALRAWNNVTFPQGPARSVVEQAISSLVRFDAGTGSIDDLSAAHVAHTGASLLNKSAVVAEAVDSRRCAIVCVVGDVQGQLRTCATFGDLADRESGLLECV